MCKLYIYVTVYMERREPRLRERPELLACGVRLQLEVLAAGGGNPWVTGQRRAEQSRGRAQARLDSLGTPARLAVGQMLAVARRFVRMRRELLFRVDVALGALREVALDASRRIRIREPACGDEAAFQMTLPELHASLRGELGVVSPLLELRRAQGQRELALAIAPESFAGYPRPLARGTPTEWTGHAAAGGSAEGVVHIVAGPDDLGGLSPGQSLVMATADVCSSALFTTAAGLILERGGALSPACMLARQLGLPAVSQVRGATTALRNGQRVRLDGDAGTVALS